MNISQETQDRFWSRVVRDESGCWEWSGHHDRDGNGRFKVPKGDGWTEAPAHRFIYEMVHDEDINGKHVHHLCENKGCCNPGHLQALTPSEHVAISPNMTQYKNLRKSHCSNGHPFTDKNTLIRKDGSRQCRNCCAESVKRAYRKNNSPIIKANTSGFRGVTYHAKAGKWCAQITTKDKHYYLGLFTSKEEAAKAYNSKAIELKGEWAMLNQV